MTFRISRAHRDALYDAAIHSLHDITTAFQRRDLDRIHYLRPRFEATTRFLDNVSWRRHYGGSRFDLTMRPDELAVTMQHLADRARPSIQPRGAVEGDIAVIAAAKQLLRRTGPAPDPAPLVAADRPPTRLRPLTRLERNRLHRATWFAARGTPTITAVIRLGAITEARGLRTAAEAQWRLLDDLGWPFETRQEPFALTLPDAQVAVALGSIQTSGHGAGDHTDHLREDPDAGRAHNQQVVLTCRRLLAELAGAPITRECRHGSGGAR